jgi:phospholipid N-methyltransferase
VNRVVLEVVESMRGAGGADVQASQITVMPLIFLKLYRAAWTHVEFQFVAANVPPGGVYHMRGLRKDWRQAIPGKH